MLKRYNDLDPRVQVLAVCLRRWARVRLKISYLSFSSLILVIVPGLCELLIVVFFAGLQCGLPGGGRVAWILVCFDGHTLLASDRATNFAAIAN